MYQPFTYQPNHDNSKGWDAFAVDYAQLLVRDTIYYLTKEVIHRQIADFVPSGRPLHVLDLNCGVGNDFPFFLARGWTITGCDGSVGMLNKACETYGKEIAEGKIRLFLGQMESLNGTSFPEAKFDLIFSVTGGYSYVDDEQMRSVNEVLGNYLFQNGLIITAHLNKFCPSDTLFQLLHGRLAQAFQRWKHDLTIQIKGQKYRMFLRGRNKVARLTPRNLTPLRFLPLLWLTPPYQTGFKPRKRTHDLLRAIEMRTRRISAFAYIADQIVAVAKRYSPPSAE
jgi:SAM-dependent methyltransferase